LVVVIGGILVDIVMSCSKPLVMIQRKFVGPFHVFVQELGEKTPDIYARHGGDK
jgi:hypothetical protein